MPEVLHHLLASPAPSAHVRQRYAPAAEMDRACAGVRDWLTASERSELATWRDAARRQAWLRGRLLAKQLIQTQMPSDCELSQIEVLSRGSQPRVSCDGVAQACSLSISHTERGILAAICTADGTQVGVDLTVCHAPREGFLQTWFTAAEIAWLSVGPIEERASFVWAAKEAIYKACHEGESFDPRAIEILPDGIYRYRGQALPHCRLESWRVDGQVAVLAVQDKFGRQGRAEIPTRFISNS